MISSVHQSGDPSCRHVGSRGTERRCGDGFYQRILPLLPQGWLLSEFSKLLTTILMFYAAFSPQKDLFRNHLIKKKKKNINFREFIFILCLYSKFLRPV